MSKIQLLNIEGTEAKLLQELERLSQGRPSGACPDVPPLPAVKRKMLDYQMAALYILAQQYNRIGMRILEIGTGHGASGYMLARGAPLAQIISLTVSPAERAAAKELWRKSGCRNITSLVETSWEYLARAPEKILYDMVFVDGDHNRIARDLPWFNHLTVGGLLLCHDYSPEGSRAPSPIVYAELNSLAARLGRPFDVSLIDDGKVGMVGFYRQEGETA